MQVSNFVFTLAAFTYRFYITRRPERVCWCSYLPDPPISINGRVIILQHPDEEKRNLKTGLMLLHGLAPSQCLIFYGNKFPLPKHEGLREMLLEPNTYVLYPGKKAQNIADVKQSLPPENQKYNMILIDGTWKQAKSMFFHSKMLHSLPQVRKIVAKKAVFIKLSTRVKQ